MKFIFTLLATVLFTSSVFSQEATEEKALLNMILTNMENVARPHEKINLKGQATEFNKTVTTDADGKCFILLPEGDTYKITVQNLRGDIEYSMVEVPKEEGAMEFTLTIQYEPAKSMTFTLDDLNFDTGKSTIRSSSYAELNELVQFMKMDGAKKIEIAGHTDNVGDDASNMTLSQARAQAVVDYLVKKGIAASKLVAKGYGESNPIADNTTAIGRAKNRRTEVRILEE